jgi:demethylmenaquinone methyltransferase / 2-methoxy-6-polyprenyl-1,4-benzoquinol methylase
MTPHEADLHAEAPHVRPHAPLTDYYANAEARANFVRRIFDETAQDYDRIERVLAFGTGSWYRRQALMRAGLKAGDQVLDVGIGTGLLAREALALIGPRGELVGVDPSVGMMAQVPVPGLQLLHGVAEALPRADASADFVSLGYALRHIEDLAPAFAEFHRVVRPGGRVLILEITKPATPWGTRVLRTYMRTVVPLVAAVVGQRKDTAELWRYFWDTIDACIPPEQVMAALRAAGFTDVQRHLELGIFSEYTARRPQ